MLKRTTSLMLVLILTMTSAVGLASASTTTKETVIKLTDTVVTVDGEVASTSSSSAVYTGASIVYYEDGKDSSYGEGTESDAHSAEEAAKHTVVTITEPGTYLVSGKLSAGQLAVDLGTDAASDPTAVVTLILDGVDITNTVAPGVIFYNVYEPYSDTEDTKGIVDLSQAGAQVILADNAINTVNGAYVARIYKTGTTKKLHKYDGAFYSKMSMNISGEAKGTGELHITATNEGLDSELHLALNGGKVYIEAQDDGINTNEDGISVTSINGGYLYVNAGLGAEGDGIDSNGYLTINGGTIVTMANERSPDGGIDADSDIIINGGTVLALGTRNDATSSTSKQPFIELSFASTHAAGSKILLTDTEGNELLSHTAEKAFQSVTFSSADLKLDTEYHLYIDGIQQQYTGNSFGMMGGGPGGNPPGDGNGQFGQGTPPTGERPDNGMTNGQFPEGTPPEGTMSRPDNNLAGMPEGSFNPNGQESTTTSGEGSTAFVITETVHSFSGVSEATDASGKTKVTFTVNDGAGIQSVASGKSIVFDGVSASVAVPESDIQLTVTDMPSENYSETFLLSELKGDFSKIMPQEDGQYRLTIAVVSSNETYTGVSQWQFAIGVLPFTDVNSNDVSYNAIKSLYEQGIMIGTSSTRFSPNSPVTRASAITTLGRLLKIEQAESSSFNDVVKNSWYSGYVGWAAQSGIVIGDGKGNFMPNANVTVEQMKLIISRYVKLSGLNISIDDLFPSTITGTMTRAELATLLSKLL
ncbi:carbohydrate-binding domain-containing protein [Paenibacillus endoradicis]|uniref:carbohydrate-binding domain-containing protein n=1 Tax=Paenibacillus endoradicis TaxID=2972487 RepID=UPI0021590DC4|nr:carbohydrate-binding domain-containing protein [Paenibacillus endoradicis]MCR8659764.1 carbohydrate-binding domain-containing protein [Paenibacillus endoradicis]